MSNNKLRATAAAFIPTPASPFKVDAPAFVPAQKAAPSPLNPKASSFVPIQGPEFSNPSTPAKPKTSAPAAKAPESVVGTPVVPGKEVKVEQEKKTDTKSQQSKPEQLIFKQSDIKLADAPKTKKSDPAAAAAAPPAAKTEPAPKNEPKNEPAPKTPKLEPVKPVKMFDKASLFYKTEYLLLFQPHFTNKPGGDFPDLFALFDEKSRAFAPPKPRAPRDKTTKPVQRQTSFRDKEVLQKSDSAYTVKRDTEGLEKLTRVCKSILNKLTPDKLASLVDRAKAEIQVTSPEELKVVVNCVFEKALAEPIFSATYAEFCVKMVDAFPKFNKGTEGVSFKKTLLVQCQNEFEGSNKDKGEKADKAEKSDKETTEKPASDDDSEVQRNSKRRMLGSIRFIGELFVRGQLSGGIMVTCINTLLANPVEEESLEVLCQLLETVGLVMSKNKEVSAFLDRVFVQLKDMTKSAAFSSRIKFLILDVIDMREKGWQPKTKKVQPKKVEVKKEEKGNKGPQDRAKATARLFDLTKRTKDRFSIPTPGVTPGPTPQKGAPPSADEWVVQSGKKGKKPKGTVSPTKQKKVVDVEDENLTKVLFTTRNAFDLPDEDEDGDEVDAGELGDEVGELVRELVEDGEGEEEGEDKGDGSDDSSSEFQREIRALLEEFFSCEDLKEATLCVMEKIPTSARGALVYQAVVFVVETKHNETKIPLLITFLTHLHKEKILTTHNLSQGLHHFFRQAADLSIDNPRCNQDAAAVFGPLMVQNLVSFSAFKDVDADTKAGGQLEKFLGATLSSLYKTLGEEQTQALLKSSGVNASSFLRGTGREADFISRYELGNLVL